MKIAKIIIISLLSLLLVGCGEETSEIETEEVVNVVNYIESELEINTKNDSINYSVSDMIPLISDNITYGFITINQITRLGIYDWSNNLAISNNIKHSYTVNLTIHPNDKLLNLNNCVISCDPKFINKKGKKLGSYAYVGWSGFPEQADFLNNKKNITIEVAIQPETKSEDNMLLQLNFTGTNSLIFDPIVISNSLKHVVKGQVIHKLSEPVTINSINGGSYRLKFSNAYYGNFGNSTYNSQEDEYSGYQGIKYDLLVRYLKEPTKNIDVSKFDSISKSLFTSQKLNIQTNTCPDLITDNELTAGEPIYDGADYYEDIIKNAKSELKVGEKTTSRNVRKISSVDTSPSYVRFYLEFPEEIAAAKTIKDKLNVKSRYIVLYTKLKPCTYKTYAEYFGL